MQKKGGAKRWCKMTFCMKRHEIRHDILMQRDILHDIKDDLKDNILHDNYYA